MKRLLSLLKPIVSSFVGIGTAVGAAFMAPSLGASGGVFHTEILVGISVFTIFLIQGLQLPSEQVKQGLVAWRVHLFARDGSLE